MIELILQYLIISVAFSIATAFLLGIVYLAQRLIERFILHTLPLLADVYGSIRYPRDFNS